MIFPTVFDNTIRKDIALCHTMAMRRHIEQIRPIGPPSIDLHFGGCFATGIEWARKFFFAVDPISSDSAIKAGIEAAVIQWGDFRVSSDYKGYKSLDRMCAAIRFYFECWPLGEDGLTPIEDGIESSFCFDLPLRHPDTDELLKYAGKRDMVATDKNKRIHVVDEKSTSRLGESWVAQWDLDGQMTSYIWAVQRAWEEKMGPEEMPEIMAQIRGLSILKNDFGHVEIPIIRPDWMIQRWYNQLLADINKFRDAYMTGQFDQALHSNACTAYNRPCDYQPLCLSPNPERLVPGSYQTVVWNPLAKKGEGP